jgi:hypothetical protein
MQLMALTGIWLTQVEDTGENIEFAAHVLRQLIVAAHPEISEAQWEVSFALFSEMYKVMLDTAMMRSGGDKVH